MRVEDGIAYIKVNGKEYKTNSHSWITFNIAKDEEKDEAN